MRGGGRTAGTPPGHTHIHTTRARQAAPLPSEGAAGSPAGSQGRPVPAAPPAARLEAPRSPLPASDACSRPRPPPACVYRYKAGEWLGLEIEIESNRWQARAFRNSKQLVY